MAPHSSLIEYLSRNLLLAKKADCECLVVNGSASQGPLVDLSNPQIFDHFKCMRDTKCGTVTSIFHSI